jgi:peptide/nickel transport system substrate-binding protein
MTFMVISGCSPSTTSPTITTPSTTSTLSITTSPTTPTALTPQKGGDLRILTSQAFQGNWGWPGIASPSYNPFLPQPVTECLLNIDKQGHPVPNLVDSWEFTPDKKSLILHLHKGVKFSDGTDFNANTAKFGFDALIDSKAPELTGVTNKSQIVVVDDYTIQLNLNEFSTQVVDDLAQLAGSAAAQSMAAVQKNGAEYLLLHPVGTGPFVFDSVVRSASMKFVKNPNYWMQGKPYLDSIEWVFFADDVTAKTAFLAGDGQIIVNLSPSAL